MSAPTGKLKVTLLAGGVGGAKMAEGLAALEGLDVSIIGNIADDDSFHGLWVSPDIDTLTYSLAGKIDRKQGWGVADESTRALETLAALGEETWMTLGDRDLGLHIYRTMRRHKGDRPTAIAHDVAKAFGIGPALILPTDDLVQTQVKTANGWLGFQQYFVREQCEPEVHGIRFEGIEKAKPTDEALQALGTADLIVIAPSNPLVSIAPVVGIPGIMEAINGSGAPVFAVSPFIAGKVIKGPAAKMMKSLGLRADAYGAAERYADIADLLFIDHVDEALTSDIETLGLEVRCSQILMQTLADKARLARELIDQFREQSYGVMRA